MMENENISFHLNRYLLINLTMMIIKIKVTLIAIMDNNNDNNNNDKSNDK